MMNQFAHNSSKMTLKFSITALNIILYKNVAFALKITNKRKK